ncbi:MAG: endopeptidase La [Lachnospiraceae bacterium]|jgi:ATP-dependent Lon protease|nr:endopeptidase La [Lachnospiraceae bacterium]
MREAKEECWIPLLVLKDMALMPDTTLHLDVKQNMSVKGVTTALQENKELFVATAKVDHLSKDVAMSELYHYGTIAFVKQILKLSGGVVRVLLEVRKRATIKKIKKTDDYYQVVVSNIKEKKSSFTANETKARIKILRDLIKRCNELNMFPDNRIYETLIRINDLKQLVDITAGTTILDLKQKLEILKSPCVDERVDKLISFVTDEISVNEIRVDLGEKLRDNVSQNQKEYVLREQMKLIHKELGDADIEDEGKHYLEKLDEVNPPKEVRDKLEKEIKRFCNLSYSSSESAVLRNYIETLLEYPWNAENVDNKDLNSIIDKLEKDHYGLDKIKERIVDYMAVRTLSDRKDSPILCLVGPPGTGKTSIAHSIADALHKKYARVSLGGVRDEAEIRGHRKTYIGAMPGRICTAISKSGVNNPLILLDEIDKTGSDYKGDTASALLEVLDGEQNVAFVDHYFEVPVDLSHVLFIATANDASDIPAPLRDRMEIIEVNSYTENEKFHIAKLYLVPKQLAKNGLKKSQFKITDDAIHELIQHYTKEAGVRQLERLIGRLMQKAARGILTGEFKSLNVTPKKLPDLLGVWKYRADDSDLKSKVGIVNGLAWTKVGGDTLQVEVNLLDGKGELTLTGNLGDVMKESAKIALSCVRTLPEIKKLPDEYFEKHIVHVHVPEGATPKDGPSAGITMALAMYSALLNREVDGKLAMTGEITLKGNVLPIGGLKEKLLAAKNAGLTKVLVPAENERNVSEIEDEIKSGLDIIYVSRFEEVIEHGIVKRTFALKNTGKK